MTALCVFLLAACITDYRKTRIPNVLSALILFTGIWIRIAGDGLSGGAAYLAAGLAVFALTYPLFRLGMLGAGDVKLFSAAAGYLPFHAVFYFLFYSAAFAAILSVIKIINERNGRERLAYFCSYVLQVARTGKWKLYSQDTDGKKSPCICLAGPVFFSILLYMGGAY